MANHNTDFQPWGGEILIDYHKVLCDSEFAKFLKKHVYLVRVEVGEGDLSQWGEWGLPGNPMPQSRYGEIVATHPQDSSYLLIQESFYEDIFTRIFLWIKQIILKLDVVCLQRSR